MQTVKNQKSKLSLIIRTSSTIFLLATATVPAPVMCTSKVTSYARGPEHRGQH